MAPKEKVKSKATAGYPASAPEELADDDFSNQPPAPAVLTDADFLSPEMGQTPLVGLAASLIGSGLREQSFGLSKKLERGIGLEGLVDKSIKEHPGYAVAGRLGSYFVAPEIKALGAINQIGHATARGVGKIVSKGINAAKDYAGGFGGLANTAANVIKIPTELGLQAATNETAKNIIGEEPTGRNPWEAAKEANNLVSLGFAGGLAGLGGLAKATDAGRRLYASSGIVNKDQIKQAAERGYNPVDILMEAKIKGTLPQMQSQLNAFKTKAATDRADVLRKTEEALPGYRVKSNDLTQPLLDIAAEKTQTAGAKNAGYISVGEDIERIVPNEGLSLSELEAFGQNIKSDLRETKPPKALGAMFTGDPMANQNIAAQGEAVSRVAELQRQAAERALGPQGRIDLDVSANRFGTAESSINNLKDKSASVFTKAVLPAANSVVGLGGIAGAMYAPQIAIPAAAAYYGLTNPAGQTYLGTGLHNLTAGKYGLSPERLTEIIRQSAMDRGSKK